MLLCAKCANETYGVKAKFSMYCVVLILSISMPFHWVSSLFFIVTFYNELWCWLGSLLSCIHIFIKGYSVARFFFIIISSLIVFLSDINAANVTVCTLCV